ncbi:hypothetical protein GGI18_002565 [Coemansia linderi]|uniref:Uncharacterized protein n=1 Tax=Coemansia linderi TaxID=2663919 RepID=A0ACC1KFK4_9FUNG|nr:hypothetical protein GGI18_002565 [Coemansia linderi]
MNLTNGDTEPVFLAANLYNNEKVLPNMAAQLLELADTLGHNRIFISIYENGSTDRTKEILRRFNETLNALGIAHKIVTDKTPKPKHIHRIEYLAKLRNYALEPLYSDGAKFGRVAFLNDVYFCQADLLELLFQSQTHGAHLTCGEDFDIWKGEIGFYDTWVARNIQGEQLDREVQILSSNDTTMSAEMWGRPFQVQCCWNGMAVIDAKVFHGDDGLRFRRSTKDECSASECSLFCNDLWRKGFSRVIMVPRVKLSYDIPSRNIKFHTYLYKTHYEIHKEDLLDYCSQDDFSEEFVKSAEQRYMNLTNGKTEPVFLAANLYNSEKVLPNMATQFLKLADTLGHSRIFISIYENGSTDKTKEILHQFNDTLNALGIAHRIVAEDTPKPEHIHRIEYLAKLRNYAMEPLYSDGAKFGRVAFLNDVYFCQADLFELLFQSQTHGAHLTCGEDYDMWGDGVGFYDTWVARDIKGEGFAKEVHRLSKDDGTMVAQMRDRPFQVQCCWNGIAVIDAKVFRGEDGLRFRRSAKDECSASECSLFCNDLWRKDFKRVVMVPRVKLAYDIKPRNILRTPLFFPADLPYNNPAVEKISFRGGPKKVLCRPLNGIDSHHPDGPQTYVTL